MTVDIEEAPSEVHHYENIQDVPWDIQKYDSLGLFIQYSMRDLKSDSYILVTGHSATGFSPNMIVVSG